MLFRASRTVIALCAALCLIAAAPAQPMGAGVGLSSPAAINHAPALAKLANGKLLLCWYGGREEANQDVSIFCADSGDGGASWSAPRIAVRPGETGAGAAGITKSLGNPTLFQERGGRLWMVYGLIQTKAKTGLVNLCKSWACGRTDAKYSDDDGRTWSAAQRAIDLPGALPRSRPLADGEGVLLPLYVEGGKTSFLARATMNGRRIEVRSGEPMIGPNLIQPTIVPVDAAHLRAYFRDRRARSIYTALYDLREHTWGAASALALPNPDSAVEAVKRADGAIVLVYNPSTKNRRALALALAVDGLSFMRQCTVIDGLGDVAYPSALFDDKGDLLIAFSADDKRAIHFLRVTRAAQTQCLGT